MPGEKPVWSSQLALSNRQVPDELTSRPTSNLFTENPRPQSLRKWKAHSRHQRRWWASAPEDDWRWMGETEDDADWSDGDTTWSAPAQGIALGIEQALDEAGKRHHLILEERNLHHPARARAHHSRGALIWRIVAFTSSLQSLERSSFDSGYHAAECPFDRR
ncbi:hypothetical protein KXV70_003129 [Aspergillus fumigatus]|nr:hypothetical protein KXX11_000716 [Aspergillus fumigatus]KAH1371997.1 hypothetical protein KXX50_004661 [Aspergillus fumigatus]KAH1382204.1 hypothetical protein KXX49_005823 [Aspergillus fumigatus]KAH1416216.1 hypothetical protein KXX64_004914 [Aspergillus fumigatus]KAH1505342.1 hypothetical protein KXX06_010125 [Aspergillus fumigatus]